MSGDRSVEPGCWIGDFLVLLLDAAGPYCVNLSVKKSRQEFKIPRFGVTIKTDLKRAARKAVARHRSEEILYREVGIPTHQVASDDLNPRVVANLQQLWLWQGRAHRLTRTQQETIQLSLREAVDTKVAAWEVLQALERREGIRTYDAKIILYELIRDRKLRIDLYRTFFIDQPMVSETKDVLDEYGHWFKRPKQ